MVAMFCIIHNYTLLNYSPPHYWTVVVLITIKVNVKDNSTTIWINNQRIRNGLLQIWILSAYQPLPRQLTCPFYLNIFWNENNFSEQHFRPSSWTKMTSGGENIVVLRMCSCFLYCYLWLVRVLKTHSINVLSLFEYDELVWNNRSFPNKKNKESLCRLLVSLGCLIELAIWCLIVPSLKPTFQHVWNKNIIYGM